LEEGHVSAQFSSFGIARFVDAFLGIAPSYDLNCHD
jgi:hypothetical protein